MSVRQVISASLYLNLMLKNFVIVSLVLFANSVFSQDLFALLSPESPDTSIDLEGTFLPDSEIDHSGKETHVFNQTVDVTQKVYKGDKNQFSVGARYNKLDLNNGLDDFYNQQGTLNWKHSLPDERFILSNLSFGAASDRPFKNSRDNTIGANILWKYDAKWFVILNYSNNRSFLNNVPLPGAFYVSEASRTRTLIIGFPFLMWIQPVSENWSFRYLVLMPWSHRLRFYYEKFKVVRPYLGFEQHPQTYFIHDRKERYDRLFWFERRLTTGIEGMISPKLKYDFGGGYAFDREFFEARNFQEKKNFLINLEASWYVGLTLRYKF